MSMFEKAARQKLRFQSKKGNCSVEELWDLPLTQLDAIYRDLNAELREEQEDSLLDDKTDSNELLRLKIEIVKHIVYTRKEENRQKELEKQRKEEKQKIMEIMQEKKEGALREKSMEELQQRLENLG